MKTLNQIRTDYLDFFKKKGHTLVESDSLVPKDDPTVLFTTAGMQQFKRQFLGHIDTFTTAASSQKCLRTDDLDEVGRTDFHHTFFEMLGNFSFGEYFKKEAITWAWEFLTQELQLDPERLWVSVYHEDTEAESIWRDDIKISPRKIFKLGGKSNFWPSNAQEDGPNGPCGPCSEIFYDYEPDKTSFPKDPDEEDGRFSEVWNLVFTQFNRTKDGSLEQLPNKNIDTGMGLERLTAVLQGKRNNFETDVFQPILNVIDKHIAFEKMPHDRNERYVIADHLRAVVFGIADGVIPSNKDRGSVMRRLIIEMTDIAVRRTGSFEPMICQFIPATINAMEEGYPYLTEKLDFIVSNVTSVEKAFLKVRKQRVPEFQSLVHEHLDNAELLGEKLFLFKSTYGLTLPTMKNILQKASVSAAAQKKAIEIYDQKFKKDQAQSRAGSKMVGDVFTDTSLNVDASKTDFLGYTEGETQSRILEIFMENQPVDQAHKGDHVQIILDKTPFYAESGGQIGDRGTLKASHVHVVIHDTKKQDDIFIHYGQISEGTLSKADHVTARVDIDRRLSIMRNHTATHLLQSALQEVLGAHIKQQGSLVAEDRLRFDFAHPKAVTPDEIKKIEDLVNVFIRACDGVTTEYLPLDEARKTGAKAFFAEKYGDTVRVVSIGSYSKEFCGGTHLGSTGQIGIFRILQESAIAQGIRRIEAVTGLGALTYQYQMETTLQKMSQTLKCPPQELLDRVTAQTKRLKHLEKENQELHLSCLKADILKDLDSSRSSKHLLIYKNIFKNADMALLRKISDFIRKKKPESVIILGAQRGEDASLLIASSDQAIKKGYKANDLIQNITAKIGGRGGGKPQLAQAGAKYSPQFEQAIEELTQTLLNQKDM